MNARFDEFPTGIAYGTGQAAWNEYELLLHRLVRDLGVVDVCEVGGGANPAISQEFIQEHGLRYTVLDISEEELSKAPIGYNKIAANVCDASSLPKAQFDFIFTKMLAEHVPSGADFHKNVLSLLKPGGYAFHYFPTLFAPPFVLNKLIPERVSGALLDVFAPRDKVKQGKFPALYSWCQGPSARQLARLRGVGYEVVGYRGLFGAESYYRRIPLCEKLSLAFRGVMLKWPVAHLTAFAQVLLRKPEAL